MKMCLAKDVHANSGIKVPWNTGERGTILLSALGFVVSISIIVSLLLLTAEYASTITSLQQQGDTAYWLARSQAMVEIRYLAGHKALPDTFTTVVTPNTTSALQGSIQTKVQDTNNKDVVKIFVEATVGTTTHTVSFQYSKAEKKIIQWTDSQQKLQ